MFCVLRPLFYEKTKLKQKINQERITKNTEHNKHTLFSKIKFKNHEKFCNHAYSTRINLYVFYLKCKRTVLDQLYILRRNLSLNLHTAK